VLEGVKIRGRIVQIPIKLRMATESTAMSASIQALVRAAPQRPVVSGGRRKRW